jgi:hypothetical protein
MHETAQTTEPTPNPAPPKEQATPPCIAFLLKIVRVLLSYGRQLDDTLTTKAEHPRFPTLAAGFGTHDVRRILAHVHRGILRAMMLQRFLLARAQDGRDIEPVQPSEPADPAEIEALDIKLRAPSQPSAKSKKTDPDDPLHFSIPTLKELESEVRRRSVGRTIADICLDLGVTPTLCEGATWDEILQALTHFGANLEQFFGTQQRRRVTFQEERDKRPETWTFDWRERPKEALRNLLGRLLGEPPPPEPLVPI